MKEGGRSIVWKAVGEVLTRWSNDGKIGTKEKRTFGVPSTDMWRDSFTTSDFRRLHRDQIDDICAEVSAAIERTLDKIELKEDKPKRSPFRVLIGGKDDGHPGSDQDS